MLETTFQIFSEKNRLYYFTHGPNQRLRNEKWCSEEKLNELVNESANAEELLRKILDILGRLEKETKPSCICRVPTLQGEMILKGYTYCAHCGRHIKNG